MKKDIHGGNLAATAEKLGLNPLNIKIDFDFSVNLNPLGPPDAVQRILCANEALMEDYPEIDAASTEKALAEAHGVPEEKIIAGNGSTEIFSLALQALKPSKAAISSPAYGGYAEICERLSIPFESIPASLDDKILSPDFKSLVKSDAEAVFICSPNNPSGQHLPKEKILKFASENTDKTLILDESFIDFMPEARQKTLVSNDAPDNIITVKSLTKFFAIAGLRLGMACGNEKLISKMRSLRLTWSVNGLAQEAAKHLYSDEKYMADSIESAIKNRNLLSSELDKIPGIVPLPSDANFILCRLENISSADLQKKLLQRGILIRSCSGFPGLDDFFIRLAARPENETKKLIDALNDIFDLPQNIECKTKAKALMFVGTASNSGKSVTTAAFGRYFSRQGIKTMPFKAQNMALNSFVTKDGGEMGRAQVVQADACGVEPHTDMNPVLLKPLGNAESQIIINGKAVSNMSARDYYKNKDKISKEAFAAFDRLKERCELVVMEGAGSPAEINLQEEDFVNMRMAAYAKAAVILVADIDRGGVFASIFGTLKLIQKKYRNLVKGVIINKFRGDKSLLKNGIEQIEELTGVPVLGVMPHLDNLNLEDEDSVGLEGRGARERKLIDIAVIRLPKISNYTDFLTLETMNDVSVRYVSDARKLGEPDLIIIPGTKNTIADMIFLRESGIHSRLSAARRKGVPIIGICGGYQMLGQKISDPFGIEGEIREIDGLGFLDVSTELAQEKELAQIEGFTLPDLPFAKENTPVKGYEIHAGKTGCAHGSAPLRISKRRGCQCKENVGTVSDDGLVFGCYIHGIFDSESLRSQLFEWLCKRKGVSPENNGKSLSFADAQNESFNRLANALEENIDMIKIKEILTL